MAIANTNKLVTIANLTEFKTKYTDTYIGEIKKDGAIQTVKDYVDALGTSSAITLTDLTTPTTGYLKTYELKQGDTSIGKIDIPKDLVVTAGAVVVDPAGQAAGTYLQLTIANQTDPVYINVADLVDVYTAAASAAQVQLAISATNEISATIVAKSVTKTELADAVTNEIEAATTAIGKATDGSTPGTGIIKRLEDLEAVGAQANVLEGVQVNGADLTIDTNKKVNVTVATGSADGTIAVNGSDVAVKGLGDMAYETKSDYVLQDDVTVATDAEIDALF